MIFLQVYHVQMEARVTLSECTYADLKLVL